MKIPPSNTFLPMPLAQITDMVCKVNLFLFFKCFVADFYSRQLKFKNCSNYNWNENGTNWLNEYFEIPILALYKVDQISKLLNLVKLNKTHLWTVIIFPFDSSAGKEEINLKITNFLIHHYVLLK